MANDKLLTKLRAPEIGAPGIDRRPARHTVGIRIVTPFEGMFAQVDILLKVLRGWVNQHGLAEQGPYFLRYHTINMTGDMDIEVGFVVKKPQAVQVANGQVQPGVLPAGRYAHLTYSRYALRGNQALSIWARDNNIALDEHITPAGDAFACRYEAYLTDYRVEPRKTKWQVDLAIKLADGT
jgi:effector-binding domain-containing protein